MYVCVRVRVCVRKTFIRKEREKKEKRKNKETGVKRKHKLIHTDKHTHRQTDRRMVGQIDTNHSLI